jgi:membrane protein YfhO
MMTGDNMKDRMKNLIPLALLVAIVLLFFSKILFTDKIVRAPDIINEFYWTVKDVYKVSFSDLFRLDLKAVWDMYQNSGITTEGGWVAQQFLVLKTFLFWLIPPPASVAWFMVLNLIFGGVGTYCCCRLIGASRIASLAGGLLFSMAPENASLINAGHVLKIATICFAPWVFYCYERAVQSRRLFWFLTTGMVLAFQFFHGHWQIAFYTCLALGLYGVLRGIGILVAEKWKSASKLVALNLVMLAFFLSSVAISLMPLASWSKDTNRGVQSGENSGKGGLNRDEAMSWSLPPEELASFAIPGFFGLSRQEGGENPTNIRSYYWGRMNFTQTTSYMGLLPWMLLPLPLLFRRDRYTWLALAAVGAGIFFSMGKYSFFYTFLYDHFPGINRFRVPKMMMFIPVLGLSLIAARGIDCLRDAEIRGTQAFRRYLIGIWGVPCLLLILYGVIHFRQEYWIDRFVDILGQPTRYEQGAALIVQRWSNLTYETVIAIGMSALYALVLTLSRLGSAVRFIPVFLIALFIADVGRINAKFMFLVDVPQKAAAKNTPVMDFLLKQPGHYRSFPVTGDPMPYAMKGIPVMFTSSPVQQQRWQEFLDNFNFASPMLDIMNVKYVIYDTAQYQQERALMGDRFVPVFNSPDGAEVVAENRRVMPKGWLVPSVVQVQNPRQALFIIRDPGFAPQNLAIVETTPPIALDQSGAAQPAGEVSLQQYEGELIRFKANVARNALLVTGEKYANGWKATVDGRPAEIQRVDYVLRGVYLTPGVHEVRFVFDPVSFKIGKWLTLGSFAIFGVMLVWEWRRKKDRG